MGRGEWRRETQGRGSNKRIERDAKKAREF